MELTVKNANKQFLLPNGDVDFNLEISEIKFPYGKVTFILGKMGSGKSLFLKLLNNEEKNTIGKIQLLDNENKFIKNKNVISIVRQKVEDNLCNELTVEENLILRLKPKSFNEKVFPKRYFKKEITEILNEHSEILKKLKQPCENLSGGQKQTLSFISNTINKSLVLCLDEFLSSTDYETSMLLRQKAKKYAKENNSAVIIVSHDFKVVLVLTEIIH